MTLRVTIIRWVWVTLITFILFTSVSDRTKAEAAVDPTVDQNGNIVWGSFDPITSSNLYRNFEKIKKPDVILDMSQGFVDVVVSGLPYELIRRTLIDIQEDGELEDVGDTVGEFMKAFVGVIILVLLGVLLFLLVPIIGFCFGCCRCCGKCGGKRTQVDSNLGCKRVTLSIMFVSLMGIIGAGMAFTNSANDFQKDVLDQSDEAFMSVSDAGINYTREVSKQVDYMVDVQYGFTDELIRDALTVNNLATDVTAYINDDLYVSEVTENLLTISTDLRSVESSYNDINTNLDILASKEAVLESNLTNIDVRLQGVNTSCDCVPPFDAQIYTNFAMLPKVDAVQIVKVVTGAESVEQLNSQIAQNLSSIETEINDATSGSVAEAISQLDKSQATVEDAFQDMENTINQMNQAVKDVQEIYTKNLNSIDDYLHYRWLAFLGVTCSILFVVILMILGCTMGTICYKKGDPTERSKMSHNGGHCLMVSVFFMFVFFTILILVTCILFAAFGVATSACTPMRTLELYEQTIDYPDTIVEGYLLGDLLYNNGSYNVTISGLLRECQKDQTLYDAIKLYYVFDFETIKEEFKALEDELDKFIDDIEDIEDINFDVIPPGFEEHLSLLVGQVGIEDFDTNVYSSELAKSILKEPNYLTNYADTLDVVAGNYPVVAADLQELADDLRSVQSSVVDPMIVSMSSMQTDIATITRVNQTLPGNINQTLESSYKVEKAVAAVNETEVAVNLTEVYIANLTDIGYSFLEQTEKQVTTEFATCWNIWDMYDVSLLYGCDYTLSSMNALWFTIGWAVFFFLPSIIISVKLAKHYRIMLEVLQPKRKKQQHTEQPLDEEILGMNDMNGHHYNNGYDERLLYHNAEYRGGMTPVDNPQFIPDEGPIMAYDYRGNPIAPPAYDYGEAIPPHNSYF